MNIPLRQNEKILFVLRRSFLTYGWQIFGVVVLIGLPFFFMFRIFQIEQWGVYIFASPLVLASLWILKIFFLWKSNIFLITTERFIDIERVSLFHRELHEVGWHKIQSVASEIKGFWPTIFRIGVIKIETYSVEYDFESHPIRNPDIIQVELSHMLEVHESSHVVDKEGLTFERVSSYIANLNKEEIAKFQKIFDLRCEELESEETEGN